MKRDELAVSQSRSLRFPILAISALLLAAALPGCRSKAHQDLYRQRMATEIRVLEDKLYEAEYQNRVLEDKLELASKSDPAPSTSSSGPSITTPTPSLQDDTMDADLDLELPSIEEGVDEGQPAPPDDFDPDNLSLPMIDEGAPVDPESLVPPAGVPETSGDQSGDQVIPSPDGPAPPNLQDTEVPKIIPGDPAPPGANDDKLKPPGQVLLPDSVQAAVGVPAGLKIHNGLSRGQQLQGEDEGLMVVVNAVDKYGRMVSLHDFDVNADMTIVVLDPRLEPDSARIGRWEFDHDKVASFLKSHPVSGFHVPIKWGSVKPSGDEVIVHVRLRAEDDEMRCQARISVEQETAVAEWTPRGESVK